MVGAVARSWASPSARPQGRDGRRPAARRATVGANQPTVANDHVPGPRAADRPGGANAYAAAVLEQANVDYLGVQRVVLEPGVDAPRAEVARLQERDRRLRRPAAAGPGGEQRPRAVQSAALPRAEPALHWRRPSSPTSSCNLVKERRSAAVDRLAVESPTSSGALPNRAAAPCCSRRSSASSSGSSSPSSGEGSPAGRAAAARRAPLGLAALGARGGRSRPAAAGAGATTRPSARRPCRRAAGGRSVVDGDTGAAGGRGGGERARGGAVTPARPPDAGGRAELPLARAGDGHGRPSPTRPAAAAVRDGRDRRRACTTRACRAPSTVAARRATAPRRRAGRGAPAAGPPAWTFDSAHAARVPAGRGATGCGGRHQLRPRLRARRRRTGRAALGPPAAGRDRLHPGHRPRTRSTWPRWTAR